MTLTRLGVWPVHRPRQNTLLLRLTWPKSDVHVIGIRSKTKLNEKVLREAKNLLVVGCFCIGTNQVDLEYAAKHGIAVFNSPFANSRSVAELVIGEIIVLARQLGDRSNELHRGTWNKVSNKCWEIRGKTLGEYILAQGQKHAE
jgi:D-3-phosphoglycerate dehydrogenase / 2-oxoglutarate reductase